MGDCQVLNSQHFLCTDLRITRRIQVFDLTAYQPVTAVRFGSGGFNQIRGPGSSNIDLGVNVSYADIANAVVLVEVASEEAGHLPVPRLEVTGSRGEGDAPRREAAPPAARPPGGRPR